MPNLRYPRNIYLQNNLRLTEKRTVRDDARINDRGNGISPGPTQRPNNSIPLKEWINERIEEGDIIIPCTCNDNCILIANKDIYKFSQNGLSYQFLDILSNDAIDNNLISSLQIEIVSTDFSGDRAVEIVNSEFYKYPIIKLTKPSNNTTVGNIDEPEEFTYKLTATCNGNMIESEIVEVVIYPISINLEEIINQNLL